MALPTRARRLDPHPPSPRAGSPLSRGAGEGLLGAAFRAPLPQCGRGRRPLYGPDRVVTELTGWIGAQFPLNATITSTLSATRSAAFADSDAGSSLAKRISIETLLPSPAERAHTLAEVVYRPPAVLGRGRDRGEHRDTRHPRNLLCGHPARGRSRGENQGENHDEPCHSMTSSVRNRTAGLLRLHLGWCCEDRKQKETLKSAATAGTPVRDSPGALGWRRAS